MKKLFIFGVLLLVIVGFSSCKKKDPEPEKSKACDIVLFNAGNQNWSINGLNITASFTKGTIVGSFSPTIKVSDKASVNPASGAAQDFSNERSVSYVVTAEDGKTTKTYTAKATISLP